jgi:hypothetical protein
MSVQPPDPNLTTGYCSAQDLTDFFDKYDAFLDHDELFNPDTGEVEKKNNSTLSESDLENPDHWGATNPTRSQVEARVMAESNWIDEHTGHAWRSRRVAHETKSLSQKGAGGTQYYWRAGSPLKLMKRSIRTPLDPEKGDKIEVWEGDRYEDWVASDQYNEGRDEDYWVEKSTGMLYIYRRHIFFQRHKEIRVSYRYGKESVPQIIRDVCARRVAAHYLETQQYRITTPGNEEAPDPQAIAESWRETCETDLKPFEEIRTLGNQ